MGLFSSSYKYYAFAASGDLIPPEDRGDTLETSLLSATASGESITGAVRFAITTDMGARGRAMIKYAAKYDDPTRDGGYIRGLPSSNQANISITEGYLLPALERGVGEPVAEAPWAFVGGPNETFLLLRHIQSAYLDPVYFPWPSGPPTVPVWDEDLEFIEIPVVDPSTGAYYVTENNPIFIRTEYVGALDWDNVQDLPADIYARITYGDIYLSIYSFGYAYTDNTGATQTWVSPTKLDLTEWEGQTLVQVKYITVAEPLVTNYWIYTVGSNDDPELESHISKYTVKNNFMPVVVMMQDRVWFNEEEDTELHITTNKLLKKLALKGDNIREDFEEQEAEDLASGDAKKKDPEKWDFFIHFVAPVMSKVRGTMEYLYYFFLEMEKNQQHTFEDYQRYLLSAKINKNGYDLPQPISEITITEGGINGYNVRYGWSYIYSETFDGRWTGNDLKELKSRHFDSDLYERLKYNDAKYRIGVEEMHGTGIELGKWNNYSDPEATNSHKNGYHDYVIYTKQHYDEDTDTWSHTRVLCMGLSMEYTINTRDTAEGAKGYRFRYAEPHIFDINEDTGEYLNNFRIPVHIGIMQDQMRRMHHEELLQDSLSATVFLVKQLSIPWYKSGFWKWLIVIVAIILIVLSIIYAGGAGTETLIGAIVSALGATGLMAFILYVVLVFAMGFIIGLASQTIGEEFGQEWGQLFAIIAAIAMMYANAGGDWANLMPGLDSWGAAQVTLTTTLTVVNMGLQVYQTHALAKLEADLKDFMMTAREKAEELREAWDQLGPPKDGVDPFELFAATNRGATGEYPGSFLQRSLNANPGLLGYHYVYSFTKMALLLPQTPGEQNAIEAQQYVFQKQIGAV